MKQRIFGTFCTVFMATGFAHAEEYGIPVRPLDVAASVSKMQVDMDISGYDNSGPDDGSDGDIFEAARIQAQKDAASIDLGENTAKKPDQATVLAAASAKNVAREDAEEFSSAQSISLEQARSEEIEISAGTPTSAFIAIGALNRINTPFRQATVKTADRNAEISIEEGEVFVVTNSSMPVGLFIREKGVPESTITINLIPRQISPQSINLTLDSDPATARKLTEAQKKNEISQLQAKSKGPDPKIAENYIRGIKEVLKVVASGGLPRGYALQKIKGDPAVIRDQISTPCRQNILQALRQQLVGSQYIVDVFQVANPLQEPQQIREELCYHEGVVAVSAYGGNVLDPGEQTELYVMRKIRTDSDRKRERARPRVIE